MTTWLDSLLMEINNISLEGAPEPQTELSEEDHVVGEATEEMKRLYAAAQNWERQAAEAYVAARYEPDDEKKRQHAVYAASMANKSSVTMDIFWIEATDAFDLWGKIGIGIRKGWQIVWQDRSDVSLLDVLGGLLGGK